MDRESPRDVIARALVGPDLRHLAHHRLSDADDILAALAAAGFTIAIRSTGPAHFDMSKAEGDGT